MLKASSKPSKVGKKRKHVDILYTHKVYQDVKLKELSQQATEKIQAEMAQKQQANAQQNNNGTIAQFLAP